MLLGMKLAILRLMGIWAWGIVIQENQKINITCKLNNDELQGSSSPEPVNGKHQITYQVITPLFPPFFRSSSLITVSKLLSYISCQICCGWRTRAVLWAEIVGQPQTSIGTLIQLHTLEELGVLLHLGLPFHRLVTVLRVRKQVLLDMMKWSWKWK